MRGASLIAIAVGLAATPATAQTATDSSGAGQTEAAQARDTQPGQPLAPEGTPNGTTPDSLDAVGQQATSQDAATQDGGEIVVTGSRIAQKGFSAPTPVTAITQEELLAKAPVTVNDIVRDIPQLRPNLQNNASVDPGISTFNLRNLGATRTLTLIDGRRAIDSSPISGFDTNLLPAALISRVEVVTAGASSVYGSDAVTGVVNIFLDGKFDGLKINGEIGVTDAGDNRAFSVNAAAGTDFGGGRGHVVVAGSLYRKPDIVYAGARDWGEPGWVLLNNAAYTPTNDQPRRIQVRDGRLATMTAGGLITSAGPLQFTQFGENGAQSTFRRGTNVTGVYMQGGDGELSTPRFAVLSPQAERDNLFGRASWEFGDRLDGFVEGLYARSLGRATNVPNYNNADITVSRDNAFLPTNIRAAMVANNLTTIRMGRLNYELGINDNTTEFKYLRGVAGLNGKLFDDWKWDASVTYTKALLNSFALNNRNNANWNRALDSVIGPNGQPICRSTLTNPGDGCAPANVFGVGSVSPAAVAYATGTSTRNGDSRGLDIQANFSGDIFSTWAGPVSVAFGGEYRDESVVFTTDPISEALGWRQSTALPYRGDVQVKEAYLETSIPLAGGSRFVEDLRLDLAGRVVDYTTSGSTFVWKASGNYAINKQLRFRGTYSRDFRAPKINELFAAPTRSSGSTVFDPVTNTTVTVDNFTGGNPTLMPERATTKTVGAVFRPDFLRGFSLSVDYYDIDLKDAISGVSLQETVDRCVAGDQSYCGFITREPVTNRITSLFLTSFNAQRLRTNGVDIEASYVTPLSRISSALNGTLSLSSVASYVNKLETVSISGASNDSAGQLMGTLATPKWRDTTTLIYRNSGLTARVAANIIGGGKYNNLYNAKEIDRNNYPAYVFTDTTISYEFQDGLELYLKVENITDTDPPIMASNEAVIRANATNLTFYPLLGRTFAVGGRLNF
ncbi:TonB-dependent receptor plug domain-containing protein [uncultured Sphingomonas sp.]|uniref:TonB-dependent receptor plug domain-containing protein n=1 Tax=uncultured Sphingomonas sp. TaxID=158754 RepID=UPI0035CC6AD2